VTGLLFAAVAVVAAAVWIQRGMTARRHHRQVREGPGTSPAQAIPVRSFDDIDRVVAEHRCHCGLTLSLRGEDARQDGNRPLRVARLACDECEEMFTLFFDLSEVRH
jgi:hypothetical protein